MEKIPKIDQNVEKAKDWSKYYKETREQPPSDILIKSLSFLSTRETAIDIGAGALKNTKFLLEQGFSVTAIDNSHLLQEESKKIEDKKLFIKETSFNDYNFEIDKYDIAVATYALPFCIPDKFNKLIFNIKKSLRKGGVFCGQLFGVRDSFNSNLDMTFHTKEQIEILFSDMEIIQILEEEKDTKSVLGKNKHLHVYHVITRKN